ncbi:hypothetical protein ABHI18_003549 [Aspergillus niger]
MEYLSSKTINVLVRTRHKRSQALGRKFACCINTIGIVQIKLPAVIIIQNICLNFDLKQRVSVKHAEMLEIILWLSTARMAKRVFLVETHQPLFLFAQLYQVQFINERDSGTRANLNFTGIWHTEKTAALKGTSTATFRSLPTRILEIPESLPGRIWVKNLTVAAVSPMGALEAKQEL